MNCVYCGIDVGRTGTRKCSDSTSCDLRCERTENERLRLDLATAQGLLARTMGQDVDMLASMEAILKHREEHIVKLEAALSEIARGKSKDDIGCLADEWMLMAGRLVRIAQVALGRK